MKERPDLDDDTLLSAYLDGELADDEADRITERLAREPALMRRLEAMQSADAATRQAFETLDEQPMPAAVLDMLGASAGKSPGNVVPFPQRVVRNFAQLPVALAASVALVAGFLVSNVLRDAPTDPYGITPAGVVAAGSDLHELLEHGISAEPQQFAGGATGQLVLTFEDKAGDWCRHLVVDAGEHGVQGVACRRGGTWQVEALGFGAAIDAGGPFRQASGTTPAAVDSAIDALIGPRDPLGADEERSLISNTWEKAEK